MELTWHNGRIVVHNARPLPPQQPPPLFIHEDEMASWLHHPLQDDHPFDNNLSSDLLYPAVTTRLTVPRIVSPGTSNGTKELGSVVESNVTPEGAMGRNVGIDTMSFDHLSIGTATDESLAELDLELMASDLKKRKAPEAECPGQDFDAKAEIGAPRVKRTRAAEVHNLSERKHRDRINEKMKALQELIPLCNKSDKASMLDDAFEYLKSLQMQVQMMSMGCGMVPMMFPVLQQYMQPMGMEFGIEMNHRMMQYPMTTQTHLSQRFPVPSYHHPSSPFIPPDSSIQVPNSALILRADGTQIPNQSHAQGIPDQQPSYQAARTQPSQNLPENLEKHPPV